MRPFVILTIVSLFAVAQADPNSGTPAVTPTPNSGSDAGSAPGSGEIAPPAPDANPKKVQEAKDIAKTADLPPILPSPSTPTKPAYLLSAAEPYRQAHRRPLLRGLGDRVGYRALWPRGRRRGDAGRGRRPSVRTQRRRGRRRGHALGCRARLGHDARRRSAAPVHVRHRGADELA